MFPPFFLLLFTTFFALPREHRRLSSFFVSSAVSLLWFLACALSGDRRLFFPFTLALAFQLFALRGVSACLALVGLFLAIRIFQNATFAVLAVELILILPALGLPVWLFSRSPGHLSRRLYYTALTSLLAFASLAF
jgi:hypothetical protein